MGWGDGVVIKDFFVRRLPGSKGTSMRRVRWGGGHSATFAFSLFYIWREILGTWS